MENVWVIAALWIGLALTASVVSTRLGISVALVEIFVGIVGGNFLGLHTTAWIDFLAGFGSVMLTFLAGAEIDRTSLKKHLKPSIAIGTVSFLFPFLVGLGAAHLIMGWDLRAAEMAGVVLSSTSVAVIYSVTVETGLNETDLGKLLLAACFVTGLGTLLSLGVLFANFNIWMLAFIAASVVALSVLPRAMRWVVKHHGGRVSEPEVKFLLLVLFVLGWLASSARSEAVLPAYLVGLVVAGVFVENRVLQQRMRTIAFSVLTPFYFLKAGLFVLLPAVVASFGLIAAFLGLKMVAKLVGVWPVTGAVRLRSRERAYTTLLMSTGLTFGTIAALYGLTNGILDQTQYTILVTVEILSAIVPAMIAQTFFLPMRIPARPAAGGPREHATRKAGMVVLVAPEEGEE